MKLSCLLYRELETEWVGSGRVGKPIHPLDTITYKMRLILFLSHRNFTQPFQPTSSFRREKERAFQPWLPLPGIRLRRTPVLLEFLILLVFFSTVLPWNVGSLLYSPSACSHFSLLYDSPFGLLLLVRLTMIACFASIFSVCVLDG